jgi:5-(carboxyamino)imidazole ribonucleotide synthase
MTKLDHTKGWDNEEELQKFIDKSDLITLENEFIDPDLLEKISKQRTVFPSADTMRLVQDKYIQKTTFKNAGLPLPDFAEINSVGDLKKFGEAHGYPFVIKARKYGYDGYGNATAFNQKETEEAFLRFNNDKIKRPLMAEAFVDFRKELAVNVAINPSGHSEIYPCVETIQYRHICHAVKAPVEIDEKLQKQAQQIAFDSVKSINGIGIFGVELFITKDDRILINEIAPRPHNSGHYTIEACYTSQFENCIRAVCDLPLGSSKMIKPAAAMVNLLGEREGKGTPNSVKELLLHNDVWLHLYNKKSSRTGRKMGHITALGNSVDEAFNKANSAANAIDW